MSIFSNQYVWAGAFISATLIAGYTMTGRTDIVPAVFAQERTEAPVSLDSFVRFGDREFEINFGAGIDTTALSSVTVKKIAYGNEITVNIVTTPSGTYSSDALISPHVLYPGVEVTQLPSEDSGTRWSYKEGALELFAKELPSFFQISPMSNGGEVVLTDRFTCALTGSTAVCI